MAKVGVSSEPTPPPEQQAVFIDTSLDTHLAMVITDKDTVADLKKKILVEHLHCFPSIGEITIHALKVRQKSLIYHLSDSMLVKSAFNGVKRNWFLHVDAASNSTESLKILHYLDAPSSTQPVGFLKGGGLSAETKGAELKTGQASKLVPILTNSSLLQPGRGDLVKQLFPPDSGQEGDQETNARCKKDKSKKRKRVMSCDNLLGEAPQSEYNLEKPHTNEEKVEDSTFYPVKDPVNENESRTRISNIMDVSKQDVAPQNFLEENRKAASVNLDSLSKKELEDDHCSSLSFVSGKRKKQKKSSLPSKEDFVVHSSLEDGSHGVSKEKTQKDCKQLNKEADASISPEKIILSGTATEPRAILEKETLYIPVEEVGERNLIPCTSLEPHGTIAAKEATRVIGGDSLEAKDLDELTGRNVGSRTDGLEKMAPFGGRKTKKSKRQVAVKDHPPSDEVLNNSTNDVRTSVGKDREPDDTFMGTDMIDKTEKSDALPQSAAEWITYKRKSLAQDEAEVVSKGVDSSSVLVASGVLETKSGKRKKSKKNKAKHADNADVTLKPRHEKALSGDKLCVKTNRKDNNSSHPENADFLKVESALPGDENIADLTDKAGKKEKSLLKNEDQRLIVAESTTFESTLMDQNEAVDVSHIMEVDPCAKRKKKSKKSNHKDRKNLVLSSAAKHPNDAGGVIVLRSEPDRVFDSDLGDGVDGILYHNEKTEASRIKDSHEKEKQFKQERGGVMFYGETNIKCKLIPHDKSEVKLRDAVGSPNHLDASGIIEDSELSDKRRKKSKKKKASETKSCLHDDQSAEITEVGTILSQAEKTKMSKQELDASNVDHIGSNQIDKTEKEKAVVHKGDPEVVPREELNFKSAVQSEVETNIKDNVVSKPDTADATENPGHDKRKKSRRSKGTDAKSHVSASGVEYAEGVVQCEVVTSIKDSLVSKVLDSCATVEAIDPCHGRRKKSKKSKASEAKTHFPTSGVKCADNAGNSSGLISESDNALAGANLNDETKEDKGIGGKKHADETKENGHMFSQTGERKGSHAPVMAFDKKDDLRGEHEGDCLPFTQVFRFQESTDNSAKVKIVSSGDPAPSVKRNMEDEKSSFKKRKESRAGRRNILNQLSDVIPKAGNNLLSGKNGSSVMPSDASECDVEERHLVNGIVDGAKHYMEVPNSDGDKVNFSDYFVPKNDDLKVVSPSTQFMEEDIQHIKSDKGKKPNRTDEKLNAGSRSSSLDLGKSQNLINDLGHKSKSQVVPSDSSQLQGLSSKNEHSKLARQPKDVVHESQPRSSSAINNAASSKENTPSWDASISSMESIDKRVYGIKGRKVCESPSKCYHVALRKSNNKMVEIMGSSQRSLLSTPNTIFKESSDESSEEFGAVNNSDASTRSPSDISSSSDESEGESEALQNGSDGQKILENGSDTVSKSRKSADRMGMSLKHILEGSRSYRKAKLTASQSQPEDEELAQPEDDGSQPIDHVPDSLGLV